MFKCKDCGCEFDEPKYNREYHGLEYGYEELGVCPSCGSTEYEEGVVCPICREEHFGDDRYCDWCVAEAKGALLYQFDEMKRQYSGIGTYDLIDLFEVAIDKIYVDERRKERR